MTDEHLRRRSDDCISYKDMVEYVAERDTLMHTVRAESLNVIGGLLEKTDTRMAQHELWHRDVLEKHIAQGANMRVAVVSIIVASLLSLAAVIVAIITLFVHRSP